MKKDASHYTTAFRRVAYELDAFKQHNDGWIEWHINRKMFLIFFFVLNPSAFC